MENPPSGFDDYVEHPRFGKGPRITGLELEERPELGQFLWIFPPESRIPYTGIRANPDKQKITSFPFDYYFDQKKICKDCQRPFIFFAEEKQYWFEELRFNLNADCVRCFPCREKHRERRNKRHVP